MSPEKASDPAVPRAFETLGEHYRITRKIGEGAFGVVYEAHHDLLDQEFAVKILKPELCEDEDVRARFLDEARVLLRFSHPNVVQLRHVGEQERRLYLVMDLVKGESLNAVLSRDGALEEARSIDLILQVLAGLEAAHAAGIVHRDLKPSNLLVERRRDGREHVRILDFGLSKLSAVAGVRGGHRSVTGTIIGTLAYMSPEQLKGDKDIDARSDIFSAGLLLHEMLQGKHPYPGESGIVVAAKLLRDPVPPLDPKKASRLRGTTRAALAQALERDRDARFPSAVAFAQALEGKGPPSDTSRVTTIEHARQQLARAEAEQRAERAEAGARRRRSLLLGGAAVLVLAAAGAFFLLGPGGTGGGGEEGARLPAPAEPPPPVSPPGTGPEEGTTPSAPPAEPAVPPVVPPDEGTEPGEAPVPPEGPTEVETPPAEIPGTPEGPTEVETPPGPETPPEPALPPAPRDETLARADARAATGEWLEASLLYRGLLDGEPEDVPTLRQACDTWIRAADAQARRGDVDAAVATLQEAAAWLMDMRRRYEDLSKGDPARLRLPLGFTWMHLGEAHTEEARWQRLGGHEAEADAALAQAEDDFRFALQFLQRDSTNYWEFLLRRANYHLLKGGWEEHLADLAITTQTDNTEVPPHMWIAHARGLRRLAEAWLTRGERQNAQARAEEALKFTKKAVSWQGRNFTRSQWLEAARVMLVNDLATDPAADRVPIHGLMDWYVRQAGEQDAPTDVPADLSRSRLLAHQAALARVHAKVFAQRGQPEEEAARLEEARTMAAQAVALQEGLAERGGPLVESFPYRVLAMVLQAQGDAEGARASSDRARAASLRNPP